MIVDLTVAEKVGMYTGLYYLFSTLSAIVGPISNGVAIELFDNYNIIMALAPIFFFIAFVLMLFVHRGEAATGQRGQPAPGREAEA
jgi:MFS-type transporter involved in bile tolerance (Atg22 family)